MERGMFAGGKPDSETEHEPHLWKENVAKVVFTSSKPVEHNKGREEHEHEATAEVDWSKGLVHHKL